MAFCPYCKKKIPFLSSAARETGGTILFPVYEQKCPFCQKQYRLTFQSSVIDGLLFIVVLGIPYFYVPALDGPATKLVVIGVILWFVSYLSLSYLAWNFIYETEPDI